MNKSIILQHVGLRSKTEPHDVLVTDGEIKAVAKSGQLGPEHNYDSLAPVETIDLSGFVLFPSFVEPHAHLDKAFLVDETSVAGDLQSAIDFFKSSNYSQFSYESVYTRGFDAITKAIERGYTALRTHVDCGAAVGLTALEAIIELREHFKDIFELQIAVLILPPVAGLDGEAQREILERALEMGADLVGGCPRFDPDPEQAVKALVSVAEVRGVGIDLHLDENLNAASNDLEIFAESILSSKNIPTATASHCVSLGQQSHSYRTQIIELVRAAKIGFVTLPQTNLLLQRVEAHRVAPRALPPLQQLIEGGVELAAGGDNWRDPFNPVGRVDPCEIISLLVAAGHLNLDQAIAATTSGPREVMSLPAVSVTPGSPADLVAMRGRNTWDAVADASEERLVFKSGRLISETRVIRNPLYEYRSVSNES